MPLDLPTYEPTTIRPPVDIITGTEVTKCKVEALLDSYEIKILGMYIKYLIDLIPPEKQTNLITAVTYSNK